MEGMQELSAVLLPGPCPRCPLRLLITRQGLVRPAGQVLPGSLSGLVASRTLMLFLERKTHRCSRNRPRRGEEVGPGSHGEPWESHGHA